jgi:hypothetical protein
MPNRGTSGIVGGSDITFRRHRRLVKSLSVRLTSFITAVRLKVEENQLVSVFGKIGVVVDALKGA